MEEFLYSNFDSARNERKFYITHLEHNSILDIIRMHPAAFSEIFEQRSINNIYFDTASKHNYLDNVNGLSRRIKIRVRWYGDLFGRIEKPMLEFKIKDNTYNTKIAFPLNPFTLNGHLSLEYLQNILQLSDVPEFIRVQMRGFQFGLLNRYNRRYFLSMDRNFRITTDINLEAFRLHPSNNSFLHHSIERDATILELKYEKSQNEFVDQITRFFPFRMTRSSKYVAGIDAVGF